MNEKYIKASVILDELCKRADQDAIEMVMEFVDALPHANVVVLPCKVGDTLYCLARWCDGGKRDCGLTYENCNDCPEYELFIEGREMKDECQIISNSRNLGKTAFLTRESAEAALAKLINEREKRKNVNMEDK